MWRILASLSMFLVVMPHCQGADSVPSIEDIIESHEATWGEFQTINLSYNIEVQNTFKDTEDKSRRVTAKGVNWIRQGDKERLQLRDEKTGTLTDYFLEGNFTNILTLPKGVDLGTIDVCDQKGVKGHRLNRTAETLWDPTRRATFLDYFGFLGESPSTLREFVSRNEVDGVSAVQSAESPGRVRIRVRRTRNSQSISHGSYADIFLDSQKGYLIDKIEFHDTAAATDLHTGEFVPVKYELESVQFEEIAQQLFFPKKIVFRNFGAAPKTHADTGYFVTVSVTNLEINRDLPDRALAFLFPENLMVDTRSPGESDGAILLWGPYDDPIKEFVSGEEADMFAFEKCNDSLERPHGGIEVKQRMPIRIWITLLGIAMLSVGVFLKHRSGCR